jgi:antitoxin component YwqK of YwqJK toxin-antitoxin module
VYAHNLPEGVWTSWHSNGELESEGTYRGGSREGAWCFRLASGELDRSRSGRYENDVKVSD